MANRKGGLLYSVQKRIRLQRFRRVALWAAGLFAVYALVGGPYGFIRYMTLKNRHAGLIQEKRRLTVEVLDLEREIYRLRDDTLYIEKVARERHGFARPDERVYKITRR
jgi:cell division protein FtsB